MRKPIKDIIIRNNILTNWQTEVETLSSAFQGKN